MKRKVKELRHGQYLSNLIDWIKKEKGQDDIFYIEDKEWEELEEEYIKQIYGI